MSHETSNSAVRNVFFTGLRMLVSTSATVCTSAIIARTLGPVTMGVYGYAIWAVSTVGVFANVGLPAALTKYVSEYIGSGDRTIAAELGRRLLLVQLAIAGSVSGLTVCLALLRPAYGKMIEAAAIMVLLQALQQGLVAALAGIQRFDRIALISLFAGLAQVTAVAIAAVLRSGVLGMLWATVAGLAISTMLCYRAVDHLLLGATGCPSPRPALRLSGIVGRVSKFSLTLSYVLLLDTIVWQRSEVLFLKWYSTLSEIAFYTLAYSIASKLNDVAGTFSAVLLPLYSESYGRHGLRDVGVIFAKALKYLQMGMVPLCVFGAVIARPLVRLLYGSRFLPLVLPLQILMITQAFTSTGVVASPLVVGTEKQGFIAKYGTFVAALNLAFDFSLIPAHGALGAAIANCTAQFIGVLGGTVFVARYARVVFPWRSTIAIYSASAMAVSPATYYCWKAQCGVLQMAGCIVLGGILYLCLLVLMGELGKSDVARLRQALLAKTYYYSVRETANLA